MCSGLSWPYNSTYYVGWIVFVAIISLIVTIVFFALHFMGLISKIQDKVPIPLIEFVYCCIMALIFLTAALTATSKAYLSSSLGAAAFFGFAATVAYAMDIFFPSLEFQAGRANTRAGGANTEAQQTDLY